MQWILACSRNDPFYATIETPQAPRQAYQTGLLKIKEQYISEFIDNRRLCFVATPTFIANSVFQSCVVDFLNGGAIFALCNLTVSRCHFHYNSAVKGGSIYSCGSILINQSSFQGGTSVETAGFAHEYCENSTCTIYNSEFFRLNANIFTAFSHYSSGRLEIVANNFSNLASPTECAGFISIDAPVEIKNTWFCEIDAKEKTTMIISKAKEVTIRSTVWWVVTAAVFPNCGSEAIYLENSVAAAIVDGCYFIAMRDLPSKTAAITVNESRIFLSSCCSTLTKERLIGNSTEIKVASDEMFKTECEVGVYAQQMGIPPKEKVEVFELGWFVVRLFAVCMLSTGIGLLIGFAIMGKLNLFCFYIFAI